MNPKPKSKIVRLRRGSTAYKALQMLVLVRDNFTCQQCRRHTKAPPHHILKISQGGSDVPENMTCLCTICHDLYPNWTETINAGYVRL